MSRAILPKILALLGLLWAVFPPSPSFAQDHRPAPEAGADNAVLEQRQAIARATGAQEKAELHQRLGDLFAGRQEFPQAASEYLLALSLWREFPEEERFRMARVLSWAGRLDESIAELDHILAARPGNRAARIHLARCLSWKGKLRRAEKEIDHVLSGHPEDREAMLVKANLLRWRRDLKRSIALYRRALGGEEDFGARTGLAYAFLSAGDVRRARRERGRLKAEYPYQEKEIAELDRAIRAAARPSAEAGYAYYDDSDGNRTDRYQASLSAWAAVARVGLSLRYFDARDEAARTADARQASLSASSRLAESLGLSASAGFHESRSDHSSGFGTGSARLDYLIPRGGVSASAARDILTDTAELIGNSVRVSAYQVSLFQYLGAGVTADGSFAHREYSDDNRSEDLNLSARYAFDVKNPNVSLGYRFRYRDFSRETGSGYFDPSNYLSHLLFLALSVEGKRIVAYAEPYGGREAFDRRGAGTSHWIGGGSGSLGVKVGERWVLEANAEGGTNSSGTVTGFNYFQAGVRIRGTF
ncbi:MAG: tetratricopeptide repeat protein [Deltaproteobacteria bacterium]|nr:tetratricopeptide repeat protein [Candidatus Deferrimicrobiaceae bacterium]